MANGNVELVANGFVSGWAAADDGGGIELSLLVDGNEVTRFTPDKRREDVIAAGHTLAEAGFELRLPTFLHNAGHFVLSVCVAETGDHLPGSPVTTSWVSHDNGKILTPDAVSSSLQQAIESITDADTLLRYSAIFSQWLQKSIDRANALKDIREDGYRSFAAAVTAAGGLQGSLAHFLGLVQQRYPRVELPRAATPRVSVIVPVHNKFQLTYDCVMSMLDHPPKASFEVIIVDDCSKDETLLAPVVLSGGCRVVRTPKNLGFVGTCNLGASEAKGEYLFFLNNDTLMRDGWLDGLVDTLDRMPAVGIAGSRLLFADGRLQEAGGIVWRDGSAWNWGRNEAADDPRFAYMRDADYVSGAALMIRRQVWEGLNGFDEFYAPAYYEDTDICFRTRALGHRVVVQPASTIVHLEGQSNGTDVGGSGLKRYQVVNAHKFRSRWAPTLKAHRPNGEAPRVEAERATTRRVLFIDDTTPTPDQDAGSNAALQHMLALQRAGYKVVFIPADNVAFIERYTPALQALGVECWHAPYVWSLEDLLRRGDQTFDLVYIHRRGNFEKYAKIVRKFLPAAKVIFNCADLHGLREMREAEVKGATAAQKKVIARALDRELAMMEEADATIVHSSFERDYILAQGTQANVHVVHWPVPVADPPAPREGRSGVAFVGGFGHPPNVDAVDWFMAEIWPEVTAQAPDLTFHIVGSRMPDSFQRYAGPNVVLHGYVEDLDALLDRMVLTVAPLRYGAGIKGKVLSSLARGTPCVMTPVAAEGIPLPEGLLGLVQDEASRLVQAVVDLTSNGKAWDDISTASLRVVSESFGRTSVDGQFSELLRRLPT